MIVLVILLTKIASKICNENENLKIYRNTKRIGALNNIYNLLSKEV